MRIGTSPPAGTPSRRRRRRRCRRRRGRPGRRRVGAPSWPPRLDGRRRRRRVGVVVTAAGSREQGQAGDRAGEEWPHSHMCLQEVGGQETGSVSANRPCLEGLVVARRARRPDSSAPSTRRSGFTVAGQCRDLTGLRWVLRPVGHVSPRRCRPYTPQPCLRAVASVTSATSSARSRNSLGSHDRAARRCPQRQERARRRDRHTPRGRGHVRRHVATDGRRPAGTHRPPPRRAPAVADHRGAARPRRCAARQPATTSSCSTASRCG